MRYPAAQSKTLLDMEVANYCEGLDPSYSTLGFENAEVIYGGGKTLLVQNKTLRMSRKNYGESENKKR